MKRILWRVITIKTKLDYTLLGFNSFINISVNLILKHNLKEFLEWLGW